MSGSDVSQTAVKLKIFALVADSYRMVFGHLGVMVRILWLPLVVMGVTSIRFQAQLDVTVEPMLLPYMVVSWLVICGVLVSVQRFELVGERPPPLGLTFAKREFRTLGYLVAIAFVLIGVISGGGLLQLVLALVMGGANPVGGLLSAGLSIAVAVFAISVCVRLGFVLPALALDEPGGFVRRFKAAWALARGNTVRMVVALAVAASPFMIGAAVLEAVFLPFTQQDLNVGAGFNMPLVIVIIGSGAISWISTPVTLFMYAIAYRTLEQGGVRHTERETGA